MSVAQNDDFVAAFIHIAQQMRRDHDVHVAAVANLANQLDHAIARRRIQSIGRLVEEYQFRPMSDCLRQLRHLLHAQRIRSDLAVTDLAKTDVKQGFVSALEGMSCGQT